jgi:hypothetical protein
VSDGPRTGEAFGFDEDTFGPEQGADPLLEGLEEQPEPPEAPEGEEAPPQEPEAPAEPEAPKPEAPAEPEAPATPESPEAAEEGPPEGEEEEQPEETEQTEEAYLWAGRWEDPKELERSWLHLRAKNSRDLQRLQDSEDRLSQMQEAVKRAAPLIEQYLRDQQQRGRQEGYDYGEDQPQPGPDPLAAQRAAQDEIQRFKSEQARENAVREARTAYAEFQQAHPEVTPDSELDSQMAEVIESLSLEIDRDTFDIAYEAAQDPDLRLVLEATPDLVENDAGMHYARMQASLLKQQQGTTPQNGEKTEQPPQKKPAQKRSAQAEAARTKATVETGGPGRPPQAPGDTPKDEFDEVLERAKESTKSVFLGGLT